MGATVRTLLYIVILALFPPESNFKVYDSDIAQHVLLTNSPGVLNSAQKNPSLIKCVAVLFPALEAQMDTLYASPLAQRVTLCHYVEFGLSSLARYYPVKLKASQAA